MQRYIARRIVLFIPTLLIASFVIFAIMRALPGDVALVILAGTDQSQAVSADALAQLRRELGLTDPLPVQYGKWLWSMVNGNFGGRSLVDKEPLRQIIARRLPVTLQLALYAFVIAVALSIPMGVIAAVYHRKWPDYATRVFTIWGLALPHFWLAMLLILGLVKFFHWSPPMVYTSVWRNPLNNLQIAIWPALVLAWSFSAISARVTRASMLNVLRQDYIRTAYSKGLVTRVVLWRHALRNALIPVTTLIGGYLSYLIGGTVILEGIFGMPGMGQGIVQAASVRDYPVVQSLAMLLVTVSLSLNLAADIFYVFLDPRISYG